MNCLFCHASLALKSTLSNGKETAFECDTCNVLIRYWDQDIFCVYFTHFIDETEYNIVFYNEIDSHWTTEFYVTEPDQFSLNEPVLEFNQLFWIFPSNITYWIERFRKLALLS